MSEKLTRPWGKIIFNDGESLEKPTKDIYDKKKEIDIICPNCEAELKISCRRQTYYFSSKDLKSHSKECNEKMKIFDNNKKYLIDQKYDVKDIDSLINTIYYFFQKKNSNSIYEVKENKEIQKKNRYYEIKKLSNLENDINLGNIDIDEYYKFIIKARDLQTKENYIYINGFEDISIPIGDNYNINKNDIDIFRKKNFDIKDKYIFCFGKIFKNKNNKWQIYAKGKNLDYIFIEKKNIKYLFR